MELSGPNSWLTGFYLAALKAEAEIAEYFGENDKAKEYRALFKKGKKWADKHLFTNHDIPCCACRDLLFLLHLTSEVYLQICYQVSKLIFGFAAQMGFQPIY
jgi:GH15 family glucan-1,4-alpha-glucosidase